MLFSLELSFFAWHGLLTCHFLPRGNGATLHANSIKQILYYHNWSFMMRFFSSLQFEFLTTKTQLALQLNDYAEIDASSYILGYFFLLLSSQNLCERGPGISLYLQMTENILIQILQEFIGKGRKKQHFQTYYNK